MYKYKKTDTLGNLVTPTILQFFTCSSVSPVIQAPPLPPSPSPLIPPQQLGPPQDTIPDLETQLHKMLCLTLRMRMTTGHLFCNRRMKGTVTCLTGSPATAPPDSFFSSNPQFPKRLSKRMGKQTRSDPKYRKTWEERSTSLIDPGLLSTIWGTTTATSLKSSGTRVSHINKIVKWQNEVLDSC